MDYSGVAAGTYNLSMGITAGIVDPGDEPPLVLPDIGFNAGTFVNIDGFNGAVHASDDVTIPVAGTNCSPGPQISIAVNIPPVSSCGTGYFATATVTITNNSGLTVSGTDLSLNLVGTGAAFAGEIYNASMGLVFTQPSVLDPSYPAVPYAAVWQCRRAVHPHPADASRRFRIQHRHRHGHCSGEPIRPHRQHSHRVQSHRAEQHGL
ncbi:MAG: hypothetical protein IPJ85_11720 [Flavobacteriales bacterium]|nr:hypothetical protein [Flavobacteriales bacterium]